MTVDYKKMLRDLLRGCIIEWDAIPEPFAGKITVEDEDLIGLPTDAERLAFAEILREIKAEIVEAGESRPWVLRDIDEAIHQCEA